MPDAYDDNLTPPNLDALVAGAVALTTCWVDPGAAEHRSLLARKVVCHLFFLQNHPRASEALRQAVANAHQRWAGVAQHPTVPATTCAVAGAAALH